jgi:hypothetical protein
MPQLMHQIVMAQASCLRQEERQSCVASLYFGSAKFSLGKMMQTDERLAPAEIERPSDSRAQNSRFKL